MDYRISHRGNGREVCVEGREEQEKKNKATGKTHARGLLLLLLLILPFLLLLLLLFLLLLFLLLFSSSSPSSSSFSSPSSSSSSFFFFYAATAPTLAYRLFFFYNYLYSASSWNPALLPQFMFCTHFRKTAKRNYLASSRPSVRTHRTTTPIEQIFIQYGV